MMKKLNMIELKKFLASFKYAFSGIKIALIKERNMKVHFFIMMCVIICGFLLKISIYEWIICIILFGIVISAEMFNTAIENIVDIVSPQKNEKAKIVKDISAGAVLVQAIVSAVIGIIIFLPKIL